MMIYFKQAAMCECEEGMKVLEYIKAHPGLVYTSEMCQDEYLKEELNEGGGSVWWCAQCDHMCSPNRPCGCGDDDWYGLYDDMWDEQDSFRYDARIEHENRIERKLLGGLTFEQRELEEDLMDLEAHEWACMPERAFWVKLRKSAKPYLLEVY